MGQSEQDVAECCPQLTFRKSETHILIGVADLGKAGWWNIHNFDKIVCDIRQTGTRSDGACSLFEGIMISSHTFPPSILGLPHYSPTNPFCPLTTCRAAWYVGRP